MLTVYAIRDAKGKIVYAGQTKNLLNRRIGQMGNKSSCPWFDRNKYNVQVAYLTANQHVADVLEQQLITKYNLLTEGFNKTSGGKTGYKQSSYFKQRMSEVHKNKVISEETKAKFRKSIGSKHVLCIETGEIYPSYRIMAQKHGLGSSHLWKYLNGKPSTTGGHYHHVKGKHYTYVNSVEGSM